MEVNTKTEEDLFLVILDPRTELRDDRIIALQELISRNQIKNPGRAVEVLLSAARTFGTSKPEGPMMNALLGRVVEERPELFERFLEILQSVQLTMYLVGFAAGFVKTLRRELKEKTIPTLSMMLLQQSSTGTPADYIIDALTSMGNEDLNEKVSLEMMPKLLGPNALQVMFVLRVLSKTAGPNASEKMLTVLDRTLDEWYGSQNNEIQDQVLSYLTRNPTEEALSRIGKLLLLRRTTELMRMIHSFQFKSTAKLLQEVIDQNTGTNPNRDVADWCVMALAEIDPELIDLPRLFSIGALFARFWQSNFYMKRIILKAKDAKTILFELLKNPNVDKYRFASECLSEIGITLDEMSAYVGESASSQVYRFFYPKETPDKIWQEKDQRSLGGAIGTSTKRFDFFMIALLNSLNFQVLYVDSAGKPGVDVVALSPSTNHMIVAGATISSLKEDVNNLKTTLDELKEKAYQLMNQHVVYPVVFSASRNPVTPDEAKFAKREGIIVLDGAAVQKILEMSRTGRTSRDVISFLESK